MQLAVEGRSITLYEEVHPLKTKEKPKTHLEFLRKLKTLLADDCRPIIVSDAGFRVPWFKQVASFGWDWVGRVRNRTKIHRAQENEWVACKRLHQNAMATPKALGQARMTESNPIDCQLVLFKAKPKGRVHKNRSGGAFKGQS